MEGDNILICRLCLKICKSDFELVKDSIQDMLNFLVLNLDLGISHDPVVCSNCLDSLKECFDFKTDCLGKKCPPFQHKNVVFKASDMCISENVVDIGMDISGSKVCCFCTEPVKCDSSVLLRNEDSMMLWEQYFPQLVLNLTVDSTCIACYQTLQNYLAFISKCSAVEGKIKEYCKFNGLDSNEQVELSKVIIFMSKSKMQSNTYDNASKVKIEEGCEKTENDEVNIKNEYLVEINEQELCWIEKEEARIKPEPNASSRSDVFQTEHKAVPDMPASKSSSQIRMYKCATCAFETKYKKSLERHMITHKSTSEVTMYQCQTCAYQTKHKNCLQLHMLTHKSSSEVTMYKCETCDFQTKHRRSIQLHTLAHKSTAERSLYQCELCTYQGKCKFNLSRHMLIHKKVSKVNMHKCELCTYQTRRKSDIQKHLLVHKNISEVPVYTCEVCAYQTKYKKSLLVHMLTHKNLSEVVSYSCEICGFQTKYKTSVQIHMLTHKSPEEVTMYKCEMCEYRTKLKYGLGQHMLVHKDASELTMYECDICGLQTKLKHTLRNHILRHSKSKVARE